jgi:hypothetical protein
LLTIDTEGRRIVEYPRVSVKAQVMSAGDVLANDVV